MNKALEISVNIEHLHKSYKNVEAVKNVSLSVNRGELFGLIGPDGAGKTSIFRILTTLLLPTKGSATIEGFDVVKDYKKIRNIVGYMPGRFSLYQDLSVEENLEFFATIFGTTIKENYHLVKEIYSQIESFKTRPAGKLSGGMKQKLALSCAMIHKPEILFLDEPTTGVDAVSRKEFWEMLLRLKESGLTIMVSTPYMDEASLCDRVALIQEGRILSINQPENIVKSYDKKLFAIKSSDIYRLLKAIEKSGYTEVVYPFGEFLHLIPKKETTKEDILKQLNSEGFNDVAINEISPTIEDCFMDLMRQK